MYLHRNYYARVPLCWAMLTCIVYPMFYDRLQLIKQGTEYFKDPWNMVDQCHIWIGVANIIV